MILIGNHHKQAIIKLINCITNTNTNTNGIQSGNRGPNVRPIDATIFIRLKQIIKVYESVVNKTIKTDDNFDEKDDNNQNTDEKDEQNDQNNELKDETEAKTSVHSWLTSNYDCLQLIDRLFSHWIQNIDCFNAIDDSEDRLWTICLLVLNIMYKMRNCLTEHKMMLELGWICLSELDSTLIQFKPNYNQILIVLQNALKEEKKDNKQDIEECHQLTQDVKRLRQKIIELQRNIIKVNKEKQVLGKRDNISKSVGRKQMSKSTVKRALNRDHIQNVPEDDDDDEDDPNDGESSHKRKRQTNASMAGIRGGVGGEGAFNCEICNKPFGSSYRLQRHMYSHTGLRPYSCLWPACNRQFNDNYHLKRHMLSHTGEKPYVCQSADCSKRFARPEDLRTHQKTHWKQSEQQMDFESNQSLENNDLTFI